MGTYISQSDLEDQFGASTVAMWSQLEETDTGADTTRIANAIALAEEYVESLFRGGRYAVPFGGTCLMLKRWCAVYAGVELYSARGSSSPPSSGDSDRFNGKLLRAQNEITQALNGVLQLPLALAHQTATVPIVIPGQYP